jgi:hypothetical protein
MLARADQLMYCAKRAGRSRVASDLGQSFTPATPADCDEKAVA